MVTDDDILATRQVMLQLRPEIAPDDYLSTVRRMMSASGYRLVAATCDGTVTAVAGYRIFEMLYCRRLLSIDDLVTDEKARSAGHGQRLLEWLIAEGRANGCSHVHLDSRVHRARAHRFYFREGFTIEAFHFIAPLTPTLPAQPETPARPRES
jgi:ribosomal protein S18 acetylase RimI-like enzyme